MSALGDDYALPEACRGSGSPAALARLGEALELDAGTRLLDAGAGVGGPAANAADRFGHAARPRRADDRGVPRRAPAVRTADGRSVVPEPAVPAGELDAARCLGVLCTTSEKAAILAELRRVLVPHGRLGLLGLLQDSPQPPEVPEGNHFSSPEGLERLLETAGFLVVEQVLNDQVAPTPLAWQTKADRVEAQLAEAHSDDARWQQSQEQQRIMGGCCARGT